MYSNLRQVAKSFRGIVKRNPVQLHILTRSQMSVATVILACHLTEGSELLALEHAVGDSNPQHGGVALNV